MKETVFFPALRTAKAGLSGIRRCLGVLGITMALSREEILEILGTGDFVQLVGERETETLECKRQPYGLDADEHKLELAKDISALANAKGGLLLIGFATEKNPLHGQDEIKRPRPFPLARFDVEQYRQVIHSWLWPPFDAFKINVFSDSSDSARGVVAIVVSEVTPEDRPLLIAKTILGRVIN